MYYDPTGHWRNSKEYSDAFELWEYDDWLRGCIYSDEWDTLNHLYNMIGDEDILKQRNQREQLLNDIRAKYPGFGLTKAPKLDGDSVGLLTYDDYLRSHGGKSTSQNNVTYNHTQSQPEKIEAIPPDKMPTIGDKILNGITAFGDYMGRSIKQILLGNFTDEVTIGGTVGQVGLGVVGLDLPCDLRDIGADIYNWEWSWEHVGQTFLDIAGVFPFLGAFKYGDKVGTLTNGVKKGVGKYNPSEGIYKANDGKYYKYSESGSINADTGNLSKYDPLSKSYNNQQIINKGNQTIIDLRPEVTNPNLKNYVDRIYKGQSNPNKIGDGTTMDAIRHELKTGLPVEGRFHSQKGQDFINGMNNLINSGVLSAEDEMVAKSLIQELTEALKGNK
jgi:hypothetical protein